VLSAPAKGVIERDGYPAQHVQRVPVISHDYRYFVHAAMIGGRTNHIVGTAPRNPAKAH
jgi:hypothetical protein